MQKVFHFFIGLVFWIQIVLSPLLIGSLIGVIVYVNNTTSTGLVIAVLIGLAGLVTGILWATRVARNHGTSWYMSRVMATPELDKKKEETPAKTNESEK